MANVTVTGVAREMGGLKESQATFRKHQKEVGEALLNIGEGKDKDDPRPAYVPQPFPKMVYHAEKGELIVFSDEELRASKVRGYRAEPYPKPQIALEDPKIEKAALQAQLKEKDGQLARMADVLEKMNTRLEELEAKK